MANQILEANKKPVKLKVVLKIIMLPHNSVLDLEMLLEAEALVVFVGQADVNKLSWHLLINKYHIYKNFSILLV